mgnify:FL=1
MSPPDWPEVAAGVITRGDQFLLACRKRPEKLNGMWEFPGGKKEPGETIADCLQRELWEELGIRVSPPQPFKTVRHPTPSGGIVLVAMTCTIVSGEPRVLSQEHSQIAWVTAAEFKNYPLLPADQPVAAALL